MNIKGAIALIVAVLSLVGFSLVKPAYAQNAIEICLNGGGGSCNSQFIDNGNGNGGAFALTSNVDYAGIFDVQNGSSGPGGVTFYEYKDSENSDCMTWDSSNDEVIKASCTGRTTQYWRYDSSAGTIRNWTAQSAGDSSTECLTATGLNSPALLGPCSPSGPDYGNSWVQ